MFQNIHWLLYHAWGRDYMYQWGEFLAFSLFFSYDLNPLEYCSVQHRSLASSLLPPWEIFPRTCRSPRTARIFIFLSLSFSFLSSAESLVNNYQMKIPPPCVGWNLFTSVTSVPSDFATVPMCLFHPLSLLSIPYDGAMTHNVSLCG